MHPPNEYAISNIVCVPTLTHRHQHTVHLDSHVHAKCIINALSANIDTTPSWTTAVHYRCKYTCNTDHRIYKA